MDRNRIATEGIQNKEVECTGAIRYQFLFKLNTSVPKNDICLTLGVFDLGEVLLVQADDIGINFIKAKLVTWKQVGSNCTDAQSDRTNFQVG